MDTVITKVDEKAETHAVAKEDAHKEVKAAAMAFFKKPATVAGEETAHKHKNPLSKRAKRHMRKHHGGEDAKHRSRKNKHHSGEHKHHGGESAGKRLLKRAKDAQKTKPAALGLYELSNALNLNQA